MYVNKIPPESTSIIPTISHHPLSLCECQKLCFSLAPVPENVSMFSAAFDRHSARETWATLEFARFELQLLASCFSEAWGVEWSSYCETSHFNLVESPCLVSLVPKQLLNWAYSSQKQTRLRRQLQMLKCHNLSDVQGINLFVQHLCRKYTSTDNFHLLAAAYDYRHDCTIQCSEQQNRTGRNAHCTSPCQQC